MMEHLRQFRFLLGGVREDVDPEQSDETETAVRAILERANPRLAKLRLTVG